MIKMNVKVLGILGFLAGTPASAGWFGLDCDKDLSGAALLIVHQKLGSYVAFSCWREACPDERLERRQNEISNFFNWARLIKDPCQRDAYLYWESLYQRDLDDQKREARTHDERLSMEKYRKDTSEEVQRWREKVTQLPQPPSDR